MDAKKNTPLTTQIAQLARAKDAEGEFIWEWEDVALACFLVARDAARMANISKGDWEMMVAEAMMEEAHDIAALGERKPLHEDGTPITFEDRIARGEWVAIGQVK